MKKRETPLARLLRLTEADVKKWSSERIVRGTSALWLEYCDASAAAYRVTSARIRRLMKEEARRG